MKDNKKKKITHINYTCFTILIAIKEEEEEEKNTPYLNS